MALDYYNTCLVREIQLLQRCEELFGLKAKPVIDRLIIEADRPLPDVIALPPDWLRFKWPESGIIDLASYWRAKDRDDKRWLGEYL